MREWLELTVTVPAPAADAVNDRLLALGAPGVIEEDVPDGRTRIRAHFAAGRDPEALAREAAALLADLDAIFPGCAGEKPEVTRLAEEDWAEGWKQNFPPIEAGRRLRIRTPWTPPADDGRLEIEILPAMAFGTGQHASTLGCLLALDDLAAGGFAEVLDVGTGSGVLALAAARLGARDVLAVDDDPVAVEAARENVARNGLEGVVTVKEGTLAGVDGRFDLILANLFSGLLRGLAGDFARVAAPRARLVVAGLLDADRDSVAGDFAAAGWSVAGERSIEGWTTLVLERDGACRAS